MNYYQKKHRRIISFSKNIALVFLLSPIAFANAQPPEGKLALASNLKELYDVVSSNAMADREINQNRIREFEDRVDRQEQLLKQEDNVIGQQEALGKELNAIITNNDAGLADLEKNLADSLGNFSELFGVTRQVAGDTRAQVQNSLVSVEFPNRHLALEEIATTQSLPTVDQLRSLWSVLLQEQIQQGRISKFTTDVTNNEGLPESTEIVRIGPFAAVAQGRFLSSDDSNQLTFLQTQPASIFQHAAGQLSSAKPSQSVSIAIDPSRGVVLGMLPQIPSLMEQYHQGGLPGYLVTILAIIGLAIGFQRIVNLWWVSLKVQKQIQSDDASNGNPLGRVLNAYWKNTELDVETLELKLEDAVLKEVPKLDRGLNTLKVLAAVAPLMGLLGTVLGMIVTFQTITLWGAGDVKLMADGISQALVTTVQGLVAAIPLLLLHSVANGRARVLQQILEEQSAGLIAAKAEAAHG